MTTIENFKFAVSDDLCIRVWDLNNPNENDAPFFYQPNKPDCTPWESKEQATEWITNIINNEWIVSNSEDQAEIEVTE